MITTINEFKKYLHSQEINEGGGAGINFVIKKGTNDKGDIRVEVKVNIIKTHNKIVLRSSKILDDATDDAVIDMSGSDDAVIDMSGYDDDGMDFTTKNLFATKLNLSDKDCEKIAKKLFIDDLDKTLYNSMQHGDEAEIIFNFYGGLEDMKFAGHIRGTLEEGDVLFNSDSFDLNDLEIEVEIDGKNGKNVYYITDDEIDDNDLSFIKKSVFPEYKVTKAFINLYNLLFNNTAAIDTITKDIIIDNIYLEDEEYSPFMLNVMTDELKDKIEKLKKLYNTNKRSPKVKKLEDEIVDEVKSKIIDDTDFIGYMHDVMKADLDMYR